MRLGTARGWLAPDAAQAAAGSSEELLDAWVRAGRLSAEQARQLRADQKRVPFVCTACRAASFTRDLPASGAELRCPRCGADGLAPALPNLRPPSSAVPTLAERPSAAGLPAVTPPRPSAALPAITPPRPSAALPAVGPRSGDRPGDRPSGALPAPGVPLDEPLAYERRIGDYLLEEELGRGSYGVVFKARRANLPRRFAVKVIDGRKVVGEDLERFQLEARLASKLEDPGVVGVIDVGREGDRYYYAMEYVEGPSLKEHLARRGQLPPKEAAELIEQLARTLHYAHEQRIVHRDLKPANVLLDQGRPRITDFGLARDQTSAQRLTRSGEVVGTPFYMAPEQLLGKPSDHRVDVFALGVLLYQLVCGRRPFEAANMNDLAEAHLRGAVPPRDVSPDLPAGLARIIEVAMAYRPSDRYLNARALAEDLAAFQRDEEPSHASGLVAPDEEESSPLASVAAGLAFGGLLAGALVLGLHLPFRSGAPAPTPLASASSGPTEPGQDPLAEARRLARAGKPLAEVFAPFQAALAARPEDGDLRLEVAALQRRRGAWDEALETVAPLCARADSLGLRGRLLRAELQECLGRQSEAQATYQEVVQLDPQGSRGVQAQCALLRLDPKRDDVRWSQAARDAVAYAPEDALGPRLELGLLLAASGRDVALGEVLDALERLAPDHPRVRFLAAMSELQHERRDEALRRLDAALALEDARGEPLLQAARVTLLLSLRRTDDALEAAQARVAAAPEDTLAALQHAEALWLKGEEAWFEPAWKQKAVAAWRASFRRDAEGTERQIDALYAPERQAHVREAVGSKRATPPRERVKLGVLLPETAMAAERQAARAEPRARDALREALCRAMRGDPIGPVLEAFEQARARAPRCPIVALERAKVLVGREVDDAAEGALASARSLGADARELDYLEAEMWWLRGMAYRAAPIYERLAHESREDRVGKICLVLHWMAHLESDMAYRACQELLDAFPDEPVGHRVMGYIVGVASEGKAHRQAEAEVLRALALGGGTSIRTFSRILDMKQMALVLSSNRHRFSEADMKAMLDEYDRLIPLSPGPTLRLAAVQWVLSLVPPKGDKTFVNPFLGRARAWLEECIAAQPRRGSTWFQLGLVLMEAKAPPTEVLAAWGKGLEVEPRLLYSPDAIEQFRRQYGDLEGLAPYAKRLSSGSVHIGAKRE
ncbi:MAG: protein kinase [Planctomycetota bacterium]